MLNSKISIITVSYNTANSIEQTILSVINQSYKNIEYIIIDGESCDGTIDIINKYHKYITYWKSEPDNGIYDAMNKGILKATGEWIIFMNSGDIFNDNWVLKNIFENEHFNNSQIIYGNTKTKETNRIIKPPSKINKNFFFNKTICHQSIFFNKSVFDIIGNFDKNLKIIADRQLLLVSFLKKIKFSYIDVDICIWEQQGYSLRNINLYNKEVLNLKHKYYSRFEALFLRICNKFSRRV